ncbi:MAG: fatty acid desaturase [Gammaproteobacteria bacterium]|nr:fatty acid desaturase [Gammaproteobacteria bacterium]
MSLKIFRQPQDAWPNLLALAYTILGYIAGITALIAESWVVNAIGVVLLTHALVIAAYLTHECAHNTIFTANRYNAWLGEALDWLTGACYGRYEDIRHKHFRHHVDHADVVAFDFRPLLPRHPVLLWLLKICEWAYIPAVDLMMHALVVILPFRLATRRHLRLRVTTVLALRVALFALLAVISLKALLLYALAYLLFEHSMRFMDVHQHTYEVWETLERPRTSADDRFDRQYEQRNTYSNVISLRRPWLNLLILNFGYHNAHHVRPTTPWHRLPAVHRELFGDQPGPVLAFRDLLISYHRHRVARVLNGDPPEMKINDARDFIGVVGVSFLTAH